MTMERNEAHINRDDLLYLASRAIDGDLTAAEQARLAEAREASPALHKEAEALARVDALVRASAGPAPVVSWDALHARVMSAIAAAAAEAEKAPADMGLSLRRPARAGWLRPLLGIGVPLAAAAALAVMVLPRLIRPPGGRVELARIDVTLARPEPGPPAEGGDASSVAPSADAPMIRVTLARRDAAEAGPQETATRRRLLVAAAGGEEGGTQVQTPDSGVAAESEEVFQ